MANFPEFFKGLSITNYYKYILYLSGIILILSLFFDVKGIDVDFVRRISFWVIVVALGTWIFEDVIGKINIFIYEKYIRKSSYHQAVMDDYHEAVAVLFTISVTIQIVVWVVTLIILF